MMKQYYVVELVVEDPNYPDEPWHYEFKGGDHQPYDDVEILAKILLPTAKVIGSHLEWDGDEPVPGIMPPWNKA